MTPIEERVLDAVEALGDEMVAFTQDLVRIPTVNPPGECYRQCAGVIADKLRTFGYAVEIVPAEGLPEHSEHYPRLNVVGVLNPGGPALHFNGHYDVVPPGSGWSVDPFGGELRDGLIFGRGTCVQKAGIAASIYAVEAIRRAGLPLKGTVEQSATPDEESGGFAGVAYLCDIGRISTTNQRYVVITEPLDPERVCIGHRGVYWFEVTTHGRIAHGSMPFHGVSAIEHMGILLDRIRRDLLPRIGERSTAMPVVPPFARHATLNINGIDGGQPVDGIQTPCVADRCRTVFDRRFLIEEGFDAVRQEIVELLDRAAAEIPNLRYEIRDLMVVHPVRTPADSPLIGVLERGVQRVLGRSGGLVASPGTYDHKHVTRIGGVTNCVAYGPGILDLAHQPDEWCGIDDLISATKVLALALLELTGTAF